MTDLWTQALREAYACAPTDEVILYTVELRHPVFEDEEGQPTAIRVVHNTSPVTATLEDGAPMNAGEAVEFKAMRFGSKLPDSNPDQVPAAEFWIDNASDEVGKWLELATYSRQPIKLTVREFLAGDLTAPHYVLHGLTLRRCTADLWRVTGQAGFYDLANRTWLSELYTAERFPGLLRS